MFFWRCIIIFAGSCFTIGYWRWCWKQWNKMTISRIWSKQKLLWQEISLMHITSDRVSEKSLKYFKIGWHRFDNRLCYINYWKFHHSYTLKSAFSFMWKAHLANWTKECQNLQFCYSKNVVWCPFRLVAVNPSQFNTPWDVVTFCGITINLKVSLAYSPSNFVCLTSANHLLGLQ